MSPAERARQIDMEEFAAEAAAARARALAYSRRCREIEGERYATWLGDTAQRGAPALRNLQPKSVESGRKRALRTFAANAKLYSAFGEKKTILEWEAETGILRSTIAKRLSNGLSIEQALTKPVTRRAVRNRHMISRIVASFRAVLECSS